MKMRHRFAACFFALGAVCAGIMIAARAHSTREILAARLDARAETIASSVAEELVELLRRGDAREIQARLRPFSRLNNVASISVKDAGGVLLYRTSPAPETRPEGLLQGRAFIGDPRGMLGSVEVDMGARALARTVSNVILQDLLWAIACIALLAWTSWYLGALAGTKIERLAEAVERIGRGEKVELPEVTRNSEIGALSRAFRELRRGLADEEARRRALEAQRDDMTNMLVHDMKHPLTVFRMVLVLLSEMNKTTISKSAAEAIAMANRSTYTLDAMIDGVLQAARIEHGSEAPPRVRLPIGQFLKDCAEVDSMIARTSGKEWELHIDSRLENRWILAHRPLLRRLIGNLVLNAVDYSPPGALLTLDARPSAADPASVEISIINEAGTIDRDPSALLNGKYGSDGEQSHVGLGLAFCKMAAKLHSGRMDARRRPDGTISFSVTLPMGGQQPVANVEEPEKACHETT